MTQVMTKVQAIAAFRKGCDTYVTERTSGRDTTRRAEVHNLITWLEGAGFFEAPASSSHSKHLAVPGGLAQHTWHVIHGMRRILEVAFNTPEFTFTHDPKPSATDKVLMDEAAFIIGLSHDLNKAEFFGRLFYLPNILASGKQSVPKPWERNGERLPIGGNVESLVTAHTHVDLTNAEMQAILWCEGPYNRQFMQDIANKAHYMTTIAHMADMLAAHIVESDEPLELDVTTHAQAANKGAPVAVVIK